ncbi:MAG TPA: single-stranded DNA-binding protein [Firmicutes bacterium]|nr:single-stranded DNA-binding protein [Bacillota bacterium]HBX24804.1 single-stranded DNA-binding protein [Bacillota bacterium]
MVNNVVLVGRLTRDPELRKTTSGMSVASFTIAVDDSRKGPNGEKVTIFMPVSLFGKGADTVVKFIRKGNLVGVVGRLTQRKYVRRSDNVEVTSTEIVATNVEFMESKSNNASDSMYTQDVNSNVSQPSQQVQQESKDLDSIDIVDDDLPF